MATTRTRSRKPFSKTPDACQPPQPCQPVSHCPPCSACSFARQQALALAGCCGTLMALADGLLERVATGKKMTLVEVRDYREWLGEASAAVEDVLA